MSSLWSWESVRRTRLIDLALWSSASLAILSAHVGAAIWLLREAPMVAADNAPPAASMIELAEFPEAANTEETDISEQAKDTVQSAPAEETPTEPPIEEATELVNETEPEDAPIPEMQTELAEELPTLEKVEVPLPVVKPRPPAPKKKLIKKEEPRKQSPEKRPQRQQTASAQANKAQAQVAPSNRTAASQSGSSSSSMTPARWQSRLMAHLERRKRYPSAAKARGEKGVVYVP